MWAYAIIAWFCADNSSAARMFLRRPLLALNGHSNHTAECKLSGLKRTSDDFRGWRGKRKFSAIAARSKTTQKNTKGRSV